MTGDEIRKTQFREQLRGYHPDDVDRLLEQVAQALDAGLPPATLIRGATFRKKFRGYRVEDVDQLVAKLEGA